MIDSARRCGGVCLVHCSAGISRSASIVIAYLVHQRRMTLLSAMALCKAARQQCSPNPGFMSQLLTLETSVHRRPSLDLSKYTEDRFACDPAAWSLGDGSGSGSACCGASDSDDATAPLTSDSEDFAAAAPELHFERRRAVSDSGPRRHRSACFFGLDEDDDAATIGAV
jgi:Dual specificity phosphatase, catalytic domain